MENALHNTHYTLHIPTRVRLAVLLLLALAHGLVYVFVIPLWQAPDEPMLYEYAALTAELGRVPRAEDHSPAVEQRLAASLSRQSFWRYTTKRSPTVPPRTLAEVQALFPMPRQVGGDPPLYFALAALPLRLTIGWPPERQVLLLRLLNALLLPGLVVCAYGAAREVFDEREPRTGGQNKEQRTKNKRATDHGPRTTDHGLRTTDYGLLSLAVAALVACHPMLAAIGASLSNDGLANLLGAALCWAILRLLRLGMSMRRAVLIVALLALGLLTKRTLLAYVPLLALLGLGWALRRRLTNGRRVQAAPLWSSALRVVSAAALAIVLTIWLTRQLDVQSAAAWARYHSTQPASRVWPPGQAHGAALRLAAGELALQPLPAVGGDQLRGRAVRYHARVWSDSAARGRLIIFDGHQQHDWNFEVRGAIVPEVTLRIPPDSPGLWFGIAADGGWLYADDFLAIGEGLTNNLLLNSDLELPALRRESPLCSAARYLRLKDVVWTVSSGRIVDTLPFGGGWLHLFFASFWGHFGWMDVPFVLGSRWLPLLALICLAGALGTLRWIVRRQGRLWQRRQVWALLLLLGGAIALPVINTYSMPRGQTLQQGRYMFPEVIAVALVLALGQSALLPASWREGWLALWLCFWPALALAALLRLYAFYG